MNKALKHWKNYEVQKPDGSWTTVAALITARDKRLVERMEKEKGNAPESGDSFQNGMYSGYISGLDKAIQLIRERGKNK